MRAQSQNVAQPKAEQTLSTLMRGVIDEKEKEIKKSSAERATRKRAGMEALMIGGDLFSMGYLAFQGIQIAKPSLSSIPAFGLTSLICGEIAGAINIGVAFICLKEGLQALKNGDQKLAARLIFDFVAFLVIGMIMILTSLAIKGGLIGAMTAFFATNPWLLPFFSFWYQLP